MKPPSRETPHLYWRRITIALYPIIRAILFAFSMRVPILTPDRIHTRRILLVLPMKGIGDLILSSPAVEAVRRQWPHATVEVVVGGKRLLDLASRILHVDRCHQWSFDWLKEPGKGVDLLRHLRRKRFEVVVDFMCDHTVSSAVFSFLLGAPCTTGFSCSRRQVFFNRCVVPDWISSHYVDDLNRLIKSIGVRGASGHPTIEMSGSELHYTEAFLERHKIAPRVPLISVHPGARDDLARIDKRWHWMKYREMCRMLVEAVGARVIVFGAGDETLLCEKVTMGLGNGVVNACGRTTIFEVLALIGSSNLFIGNNSGLLHMACALGIPTISFSGGINMARWAPRGDPERNRIMMPLKNCRISHCSACTRNGRLCLDEIGVHEVFREAAELLETHTKLKRHLHCSDKGGELLKEK